VSAALHLVPLLAVVLLWFASTGLIVWAANRPARTFRASLIVAGAAALLGLAAVSATGAAETVVAVHLSFLGGLAVWGWQALAFLTGAVTGPRRVAASGGRTAAGRFGEATAAVIHHELALTATFLVLLLVSWGAANATGAAAFGLLFAFRLSAKLNIHWGVPNLSHELLPPQLAHLKSYFGQPRLQPALPIAILASVALAAGLGRAALTAASPAEAVTWSLLCALAALGALEHLFMALPVRDGALWGWAMPGRSRGKLAGQN
jgi:putative photosynthetic complex assembly protein 2